MICKSLMNTNVKGGGLDGHVKGGQAVNSVCLFAVVLPAVWPAPVFSNHFGRNTTLYFEI